MNLANKRSHRLAKRIPEKALLQIAQAVEDNKYPGRDGLLRIDKIFPIDDAHPHSDRYIREAMPGDRVCHNTGKILVEFKQIIHVRYCHDWGCVFGVTTTDDVHLWMD